MKAMKGKRVLKGGKSKPPRLFRGKGSVRQALAALITGGKVSSQTADEAMRAIPNESRAGFPLVRRRGAADPEQWKTQEGVPVHVDFNRRPWLPDDWCQGLKRTSGNNTYTVYMPPKEVRTLYHQWQCEEYLGRKLTPADGFKGQLHVAKLAREQVPLDSDESFFKLLTRAERAKLADKDDFHFCIVSARRAQCIDGARDIAVVQHAFLSAGVTPTWYVDADSLAAYRALGLKAVVGGKLTPARNLALSDAKRQKKVCVQCSDDISLWEYHEGQPAKSRTDAAMNAAHEAATRYIISPVAAARFILAKMRGAPDKSKPQLGGAYVLGTCSRTWAGDAFGRKHFILGDFFVADLGSDIRFDERLTLKEDYDFVAQHIHAHGSVMRCNRLTFTAKHYSNSGGAVDNRDPAGLKEQQNMAILFEKWPNAIFPHKTRKNEVLLRWPCEGSAVQTPEEEDISQRHADKTLKRMKSVKLDPGALIMSTAKVPVVPYIKQRVRRAAGRTVKHALSQKVTNSKGQACGYRGTDLSYDIRCGFLTVQ